MSTDRDILDCADRYCTDQELADARATLQAVPGETLLRAATRMRDDRDALAEDLKLFRTMIRDLARRILGGDVGPA